MPFLSEDHRALYGDTDADIRSLLNSFDVVHSGTDTDDIGSFLVDPHHSGPATGGVGGSGDPNHSGHGSMVDLNSGIWDRSSHHAPFMGKAENFEFNISNQNSHRDTEPVYMHSLFGSGPTAYGSAPNFWDERI